MKIVKIASIAATALAIGKYGKPPPTEGGARFFRVEPRAR